MKFRVTPLVGVDRAEFSHDKSLLGVLGFIARNGHDDGSKPSSLGRDCAISHRKMHSPWGVAICSSLVAIKASFSSIDSLRRVILGVAFTIPVNGEVDNYANYQSERDQSMASQLTI